MSILANPSDVWLTHQKAGVNVWILPEHVFDGKSLSQDQAVLVYRDRTKIVETHEIPPDARRAGAVWNVPGILSPGFVDLQVNGGGGVLFNTNPTVAGVRAIAQAHRTTGTKALLPTVITDRPEVLKAACAAIAATVGQDGILGIHIEGPHIAAARRGTHAAEHIRPLDTHTLAEISKLRDRNIPVMITLAPEVVNPEQIESLVGQGVVVALGHSDASAMETRVALSAGAKCFTHLFNAMSQMQGREAGVTGAAINSTAYTSIICDGIHVSPEMLALAIRARPIPERTYIVSDAMPTVAGPDSYRLYDQTITLENGRLINAQGALAGAHVTMLESVAFAIEQLDQPADAALRMAITIPSELMGLDHLSSINGGGWKDVLHISADFRNASFILDQYQG